MCLCYNCNRCYVSVCTFGGIFFLKLVPGNDFQFSGGQLTKKKKTQKVCKYVKQPNECEASKIVIRGCDRNKETKPPRYENTTTINDNINNHYNINNSKNYQTTTTITTTTKKVSLKVFV